MVNKRISCEGMWTNTTDLQRWTKHSDTQYIERETAIFEGDGRPGLGGRKHSEGVAEDPIGCRTEYGNDYECHDDRPLHSLMVDQRCSWRSGKSNWIEQIRTEVPDHSSRLR